MRGSGYVGRAEGEGQKERGVYGQPNWVLCSLCTTRQRDTSLLSPATQGKVFLYHTSRDLWRDRIQEIDHVKSPASVAYGCKRLYNGIACSALIQSQAHPPTRRHRPGGIQPRRARLHGRATGQSVAKDIGIDSCELLPPQSRVRFLASPEDLPPTAPDPDRECVRFCVFQPHRTSWCG